MPPRDRDRNRIPKRKEDFFRKNKVEYVDYKDVALLKKFVSDRGKIRSARVTGTNPQFQRLVAQAVKNAREMALLPYTTR
ncbi:30S ribosomal protein S18 [soil metagenome]|jgi:small subunit ribosomal protein S18|nr:30S ribosomal protein S18 [Euzebyaceae bacterium]